MREGDDWEIALARLADSVGGEWAWIDELWLTFARRHGVHLRRDTGLERRDFLIEAFTIAHRKNFLRSFGLRLVSEGLTTEAFDEALGLVLGNMGGRLQAFQNGVFRPGSALLKAKGLIKACELVCRIDIDGRHIGTGVLVSSQIVATAAHVLWDLFETDDDGRPVLGPDGRIRARPGGLMRLTLTFGDIEDYMSDGGGLTRMAGEMVELHEHWLADASAPSELERSKNSFDVLNIDGIDGRDGPWDFALIRLAKARHTPHAPWLQPHAPRPPYEVHILHHPEGPGLTGMPLLWSIGKLDQQLGRPPVRLLHDANTLGGSSGAPVFDNSWRIVALHQGGGRVRRSVDEFGDVEEDCRNRAVPIRQWHDRLDAIEASGATSYLTELRNTVDGFPYPVIGRRLTQRWTWASLRYDADLTDRFLLVRGATGTGLRFTKRIIREIVEGAGGVVVVIDLANALGTDAAEFAARVAGARSTTIGPIDPSGLTTAIRDQRRVVAPAMAASGGSTKLTWLVLEGFGGAALDVPADVRDLLLDLIAHLGDYPWLRVVSVGWLEEAPPGVPVTVDRLGDPTAADVALHIVPPGSEPTSQVVEMVGLQLDHVRRTGRQGYAAAHQVLELLAPLVKARLVTSQTSGLQSTGSELAS